MVEDRWTLHIPDVILMYRDPKTRTRMHIISTDPHTLRRETIVSHFNTEGELLVWAEYMKREILACILMGEEVDYDNINHKVRQDYNLWWRAGR